MTNIKLLGDRLLVKVKSTKKETESGIVLPESSVSKSQIGTVVAVGDGRITHDGNIIPMVVEPDDNILFDKFAGTVIVVDDEELLLLNEYDEQLCYNVNTFTWAFDEPVDKFCFTNAVKATALKNGQGFVKIFKNNTVIQVPSYNNMPINTLDYDDNANVVIIEVLNNGEKAYAVYSVAKNQYVNTKLYASACYMKKKNAIAMISDKSEKMTDSKLNLTKQGSDYMMGLFYEYGYIIYYNPNSSDQIIFANGKSVTRKDYFQYEEVYDFLAKVRQQPKLTYLKK